MQDILQYKLGRWDGTVGFGLGGSGYINHLETILEVLHSNGVEVADIEDNRQKHNPKFSKIDENYFASPHGFKGHPAEGQPTILRDYSSRNN